LASRLSLAKDFAECCRIPIADCPGNAPDRTVRRLKQLPRFHDAHVLQIFSQLQPRRPRFEPEKRPLKKLATPQKTG
jgi:hypothetical protein